MSDKQDENTRIKEMIKVVDAKLLSCFSDRLRLMREAYVFKIPYRESIFSDDFEKELRKGCPFELKEIYTLMMHVMNLVVSNEQLVEERRNIEEQALYARFKRDN